MIEKYDARARGFSEIPTQRSILHQTAADKLKGEYTRNTLYRAKKHAPTPNPQKLNKPQKDIVNLADPKKIKGHFKIT